MDRAELDISAVLRDYQRQHVSSSAIEAARRASQAGRHGNALARDLISPDGTHQCNLAGPEGAAARELLEDSSSLLFEVEAGVTSRQCRSITRCSEGSSMVRSRVRPRSMPGGGDEGPAGVRATGASHRPQNPKLGRPGGESHRLQTMQSECGFADSASSDLDDVLVVRE